MRILTCWLCLVIGAFAADVVWQEAESLADTGGWANDPQHVDLMGSPYLLATGVGTPVADAVGTVLIEKADDYVLWVRCRDWYPSHSPGRFQVAVGGKVAAVTFGKAANDDWQWVKGGVFSLASGEVEVRIQDQTGWWGRIDALVLANGDFEPASELQALNAQRLRYNGVSTEIKNAGTYDVIVVGGGSAGLGAAIAAARNGAKVAFIQDRPVLGGNGSDEIQVPPMGFIGDAPDKINVTGLAEELYPEQGWKAFANSARLESVVRAEDNISLFLNTRGIGVEMADDATIAAVIAINVHSGQRLRFRAPLFVDTTGHGWIGHYAGADYKHGTEGRDEYGESMAPEKPTDNTMGNSLYKVEVRKLDKPSPFTTPAWAYQWQSKDDFDSVGRRSKKPERPEGFDTATLGRGRPVRSLAAGHTWYLEYGGIHDTIEDAEKIRDELFRIHVGIWGYQKNYEKKEQLRQHKLEWINYVPGVRESRRLLGDYVMTQNDFDNQVEHADNVAFTDWGVDDHHPYGFFTNGIDAMHVYHGRRVSIPYRSLYSRNVRNLFMAGRCMSASHLALGGVRVQRPMTATGQAAGTAAAIAAREDCLPRDVYVSHLVELQQRLLKDGCYIVGVKNQDPADLARTARTRHRTLIDGWNREIRGTSSAVTWIADPIKLTLPKPRSVGSVHVSLANRFHAAAFDVECRVDDEWLVVASTPGNRKQRHYVINFEPVVTNQIRLQLNKSSGLIRVCEVRIYEDQGWTTERPLVADAAPDPKAMAAPTEPLPGVIADDTAGTTVGNWQASTFKQPVHGSSYLHDNNTNKGDKSITFDLQPPKPGTYVVKLLYVPYGNRSSRTPVVVINGNQRQQTIVDQRKRKDGGASLGTYTVTDKIQVTVSNGDTDGYVVVDGIQLLPIEK